MDRIENISNEDINLTEEEKTEFRKIINNFKYEGEDIYISQMDYDAFVDYQRSYSEKNDSKENCSKGK